MTKSFTVQHSTHLINWEKQSLTHIQRFKENLLMNIISSQSNVKALTLKRNKCWTLFILKCLQTLNMFYLIIPTGNIQGKQSRKEKRFWRWSSLQRQLELWRNSTSRFRLKLGRKKTKWKKGSLGLLLLCLIWWLLRLWL